MIPTTTILDFCLIGALLSGFSLSAQAPSKPLTVEAIYGHGPLIGTPPEDLAWSPDGKHLTYKVGGELVERSRGRTKRVWWSAALILRR